MNLFSFFTTISTGLLTVRNGTKIFKITKYLYYLTLFCLFNFFCRKRSPIKACHGVHVSFSNNLTMIRVCMCIYPRDKYIWLHFRLVEFILLTQRKPPPSRVTTGLNLLRKRELAHCRCCKFPAISMKYVL